MNNAFVLTLFNGGGNYTSLNVYLCEEMLINIILLYLMLSIKTIVMGFNGILVSYSFEGNV